MALLCTHKIHIHTLLLSDKYIPIVHGIMDIYDIKKGFYNIDGAFLENIDDYMLYFVSV